MTISVPTARASFTTTVVDLTTPFDNTIHELSYPTEVKYQYLGGIYQNIGDTYLVPLYNATDDYPINQIVFKDDFVQKLVTKNTTVPKQPWDYTSVDEGLDQTQWDDRYSRIRTIPTDHVEGGNRKTFRAYTLGIGFSTDGKYFFEKDTTDGYLLRTRLVTAWDISSADQGLASNRAFNSYSGFNFSPDGLKFFIANSVTDKLEVYTLGSAWDITDMSATPIQTKTFSDCQGITFGNNGTRLVVTKLNSDTIWQYTLPVAYNLDNAVLNGVPIDTARAGGYNNLPVTPIFNNDGSKMYEVERGYNDVYEHELGTNWDITSITHTGEMASVAAPESIFFKSDGTRMYIANSSNDKILQYTVPIAWDVLTAYNTVFPIYENDYHDGNYYWYNIYYSGDYMFTQTGMTTSEGSMASGASSAVNYYTTLTADSIDTIASLYTDGVYYNWLPKTVIVGTDGIYVRTDKNVAAEFDTVVDPTYAIVLSPAEIEGFTYIEATNDQMPFDDKNYTYAEAENSMEYVVTGAVKFDTIALGRVKADNIVVEFTQFGSSTPITTLDRPIDSSRDADGNLEDWHTTTIYYSDEVLEIGSTVKITLTGTSIELGTLMLGMSVAVGFTNLTLSNSFVDYSVIQEDEWGEINYVERAKVAVYKGTADIELDNYDMTDRLLTSIGGKTIILNGSDARNVVSDSVTVFASTKKIGRLFDITQKTKISDNDMDVMATYGFTLKEIV